MVELDGRLIAPNHVFEFFLVGYHLLALVKVFFLVREANELTIL